MCPSSHPDYPADPIGFPSILDNFLRLSVVTGVVWVEVFHLSTDIQLIRYFPRTNPNEYFLSNELFCGPGASDGSVHVVFRV